MIPLKPKTLIRAMIYGSIFYSMTVSVCFESSTQIWKHFVGAENGRASAKFWLEKKKQRRLDQNNVQLDQNFNLIYSAFLLIQVDNSVHRISCLLTSEIRSTCGIRISINLVRNLSRYPFSFPLGGTWTELAVNQFKVYFIRSRGKFRSFVSSVCLTSLRLFSSRPRDYFFKFTNSHHILIITGMLLPRIGRGTWID